MQLPEDIQVVLVTMEGVTGVDDRPAEWPILPGATFDKVILTRLAADMSAAPARTIGPHLSRCSLVGQQEKIHKSSN